MTTLLTAPDRAAPARLLIVEDERIVALDLRLTLESLGFQVVATTATQADAVRLTMSIHRIFRNSRWVKFPFNTIIFYILC